MDFDFTPEQELFRKTLRQFAEEEIRPHVREWDEAQHFPRDVVQEARRHRDHRHDLPGGVRRRGTHLRRLRARGRGALPGRRLGRHHGRRAQLAVHERDLSTRGTEDQKRRYVPKLATGEWIGSWSLTEPTAGSDSGGTKTVAREGRRPLRPERRQDLRLPGHPMRRRRRLCDGRPQARQEGHHRLHHRKGHAGLPGREEGGQARASRLRYRGARDAGLRGARRASTRRRRGRAFTMR